MKVTTTFEDWWNDFGPEGDSREIETAKFWARKAWKAALKSLADPDNGFEKTYDI